MPAIKLHRFKGLIPRLTNKELPDRNAQTAQNVCLLSERLQPIEDHGAGTDIGASKISAYLWRRNSGSEWLSWTTDVDVVKGPIADDDKERVYYIDNGTMKVTGWDGAKEECPGDEEANALRTLLHQEASSPSRKQAGPRASVTQSKRKPLRPRKHRI